MAKRNFQCPGTQGTYLEDACQKSLNALYNALNIETVAKWGAEDHMPDLDVPCHFRAVRRAIKAIEDLGFEFD